MVVQPSRWRHLALLGLLASVSGLAAACGGGRAKSYPGAPIVLISIDTLRSDHLPLYGYDKVETPALSAFRREAILFERAYSHYPLTLPSHVSILTGQLPPDHGVRDNVGYPFVAAKHPFLPALLKAAGYTTGAAVSAFVLHGDTGLRQGFDFYDDAIEVKKDTPLAGLQRPGAETLKRALRWLDTAQAGKPFLFLHFYEPHTPYQPPEPYASRYALPYDGEIATVDAVVGQLLTELKARKLYDRAVIVLLSDHGEGLGDHGEEEHGLFLYREALQVPLLLKLPGGDRGGETVKAPAELVDVAPTLLTLAGVPLPAGLAGVPLTTLGTDAPAREIYSETFYPRLHMGWSDLASLIRDRFHYIEGPDPELFDLETDYAERNNVLSGQKKAFAELREAIRPRRKPLAAPSAVDAETQAKLAALGYTGAPRLVDDGALADPKSKIGSLEDLKQATRLMGRERWAEAIPLLQRMVEANPLMEDGWEKLAICQVKLGRRGEAVEVYKRALENSGGSPLVALTLASLLTELGSLDEARKHAELALSSSPAKAHQQLAEIALAGGRLAEAESHAREAAEADPKRTSSWITLAQVLARGGKLLEARNALARVESELGTGGDEPPAGFLLVKGDLEAREEKPAEAAKSFEEEIRRHPDLLDAYSRLAILRATQGEATEAVATLQRMVEANGRSPAAYAVAVETLRILGDPAGSNQLLSHARAQYPQDAKLASLGRSGPG
ncbi:MAG: sulfatase-like hydrolase/transferase [Thermoanaerobaculia bacterium]